LRDALQRAAGLIETRFAGDPAMEVRVRDTAAEIAIGIQDFEAAVMHRRRAAELLESMRGPIDPATLKARYSLGEALMRASSFEEAGDVLDAADANAGALLEDDDALAFVAVRTRGRFYMAQVQMEPAAKQFEKAMQYLAVFAPDDAQSFHAVGLDLAQSYLRIGRQEEAVAILEKLQDDARFSGAGVTDAARAAAKLHYGAALLHSGRFAEAEPVLAAAVPALAAAFGPDSGEAAAGRENLANLYSATGRWDEALALVASARETECAAKGSEHIACIARGGNEGVVLLQLGRSEEALPKIGAARDAFTRLMGDGSPGVQVMNYYLAQSLLDMGDNDSAAALVDTLDPTQLAAGSPGEGWSARVKALEGWTLLADGRRDEGSALLETAVAEMEREGLQAWIVEPFRRALSGKGR
jgi:non-specific serine/threonine protein kinase